MKTFKRFLAVLCSTTMIVSASATAFAAEDATAPATGTAGAGNVLSYNFDTVIVPTTIKITFNPQGLEIAKRDGEDAVNAQIVSLNYGIASKASQDKKVIVKFAANAALNGESTDVEFVDEAAKIAAQEGPDDEVGAPTGSHRIYLTVVPATATPTYYKDAETTAGVAFEVTGDRGSKEDNITSARLSDVVMTASEATEAVKTFAKAASTPKNDAYAILGYKLGKATYAAKEDLTFETTAAQVADKMEMTALGGITGFTFGGSMNTNTDWTKANLSAIAITPIYELADAGTEDAIDGTASAITLTEATDLAEPDKPLTADEIAAAAAAAEFKTTYADVLGLTTFAGTEEELEDIQAAISAFTALTDAAKSILAAEEPAITADSLGALKTASENAAGEAAAATAAAGFKTTYADVLGLTTFAGTEEELADIEAAISAFNALTGAAKDILAAEDPAITADTLAELKSASEAAAATPTSITATYVSAATRYELALPENVALDNASDVTNLKVNGVALETFATNSAKTVIRINRSDVKTALGSDWDSTTTFEFTFTANDVKYTATVGKNG